MAPRVTVKDLRAEARRRLLHCGNGKTISRMNKRELLEFLSCIDHPDADDLGGDDQGASVARMFQEPKARKPRKRKGKVPKAYAPVSEEPDDLSDVSFTGRGLPSTYREFVRAMLPHVRAKGLGPQAARTTVARMWRTLKAVITYSSLLGSRNSCECSALAALLLQPTTSERRRPDEGLLRGFTSDRSLGPRGSGGNARPRLLRLGTDKLSALEVDIGEDEPVKIVTNAPNAKARATHTIVPSKQFIQTILITGFRV